MRPNPIHDGVESDAARVTWLIACRATYICRLVSDTVYGDLARIQIERHPCVRGIVNAIQSDWARTAVLDLYDASSQQGRGSGSFKSSDVGKANTLVEAEDVGFSAEEVKGQNWPASGSAETVLMTGR